MKSFAALFMLFVSAPVFARTATATVAVPPCSLTYATAVTANTPYGVEVRGYCGVPDDATAVFLHVKVGNSTPAGKLYFWPDSETGASLSQCNYQNAVSPNPVSCEVLVRVDGDEDDDNLWVMSSRDVFVSLVVEGYIAPVTP